MWPYAAGVIVLGAVAAVGRTVYKALTDDSWYIDMKRVNQALREREWWLEEDEASDMCKARVRRRMKLGVACKESAAYNGREKRIHLVPAKRAG